MTRTSNAEYVGQDPGTTTGSSPLNPGAPSTSLDLRNVTFGSATFTNPCFWILVGVIGTIAVQYLMKRTRT